MPIVAHQPTGWISFEQRETQKSLSSWWPKPSYLKSALYPEIRRTVATQKESGKASQTSSQSVFSTSTFIPTVISSHISDIGAWTLYFRKVNTFYNKNQHKEFITCRRGKYSRVWNKKQEQRKSRVQLTEESNHRIQPSQQFAFFSQANLPASLVLVLLYLSYPNPSVPLPLLALPKRITLI